MTTPAMDGMPEEPAASPKIYISGTPTPEKTPPQLAVDDNVIVTLHAKVRQVGVQHEKQGAGPFVKLNAYELMDVRHV